MKRLITLAFLSFSLLSNATAQQQTSRGIIPDKEVKLSRAELLAGVDSQLNVAIEYIQQQPRESGSKRANKQK